MKWLNAVVIAVALTTLASNFEVEAIVGGFQALTSYPYMANLQSTIDITYLCGGSIIGDRFILTAAHCLNNTLRPISTLRVRVGSNVRTSGTVYQVSTYSSHPSYNFLLSAIAYDVGVLKTSTTIVFTPTVAAIPLGTTDIGVVDGLVLGWGFSSLLGILQNNLRYLSVSTITNVVCSAQITYANLNPASVCTLNQLGQGTCIGDSGGPLVVDDVVIGVVSRGNNCGLSSDVYTRVASVISYINNAIATL